MSLRTRLLLWVGLLVVASIASTAFLSTRLAQNEFARIIDIEETVVTDPDVKHGMGRAVDAIAARYTDAGWIGLEDWLAQLAEGAGVVSELMLFSPSGELLAATDPEPDSRITLDEGNVVQIEMVRDNRRILREQRMPSADILDPEGKLVARLFYGPAQLETDTTFAPTFEEAKQQDFDAALRKAVLVGVIVFGFVALAVTALATRRITQPLSDLTASARGLAGGDFSQRVTARGTDEVARLALAFNAMAEQLQKLDSARQDMVNDVAHELRTPLTNMRCQLEAVQDGLMQADASLIASLGEEALLLQRLVDDLRELALTRPHVIHLDCRTILLREQVDYAISACSSAEESPDSVNSVNPDLEVFADPDRLQQILRNLIGNAYRHTPAAGKVAVDAAIRGDEVEVRVIDTGVGFPADVEERVFERFFRADPSRSRATGGAGLGLAIVRQLVEAHGGTVGAQPNTPNGAQFWFRIPRADGRVIQ